MDIELLLGKILNHSGNDGCSGCTRTLNVSVLSSIFSIVVVTNTVLFACFLCQNKTTSLESCSVHWSVTQSGRHS